MGELHELFAELKRQKNTKIDYITPSKDIKMTYSNIDNTLKLTINNIEEHTKDFAMTDHFHSQTAQKTNIPYQYYKRIKESHPELLTTSVNTLLNDKDKLMIRTLDGKARALLSNRYRPIDNYDIMKCTLHNLQRIQQTKGYNIKIHNASLTDTHLYIKITSRDLVDEIITDEHLSKGDIVHGGIIIQNSEVGSGRFKVSPFINVCICNNGLISDRSLSRVHLGRAKNEQTINWSDNTLALDDMTLYSKLSDMIQQTFTKQVFDKWIAELNKYATNKIDKPTKAINHIVTEYKLPEKQTDELLTRFAEYGYTQWGLSQAITRQAQEQNDYEQQIEMEKIGNDIMKKPLIIKEVH